MSVFRESHVWTCLHLHVEQLRLCLMFSFAPLSANVEMEFCNQVQFAPSSVNVVHVHLSLHILPSSLEALEACFENPNENSSSGCPCPSAKIDAEALPRSYECPNRWKTARKFQHPVPFSVFDGGMVRMRRFLPTHPHRSFVRPSSLLCAVSPSLSWAKPRKNRYAMVCQDHLQQETLSGRSQTCRKRAYHQQSLRVPSNSFLGRQSATTRPSWLTSTPYHSESRTSAQLI